MYKKISETMDLNADMRIVAGMAGTPKADLQK